MDPDLGSFFRIGAEFQRSGDSLYQLVLPHQELVKTCWDDANSFIHEQGQNIVNCTDEEIGATETWAQEYIGTAAAKHSSDEVSVDADKTKPSARTFGQTCG